MPSESQPYNVTATGVVYAGACQFRGCAIGSTAGATVVLYDNASAASGTVLASFTLAANGFQPVTIPEGVRCTNGIYLSTTATVQGHVRVG